MNTIHLTIKFTMRYLHETINFSYVQVSKNSSRLEADLYSYDTERCQNLHAKSCHRHIYKKSIPVGQAIRSRRIISGDIVSDECLKELETWFINRGYNSEKVRPDIDRVKTINRNDLLTKREKEIDNKIIRLIIKP